jgi:hypothetical protein
MVGNGAQRQILETETVLEDGWKFLYKNSPKKPLNETKQYKPDWGQGEGTLV